MIIRYISISKVVIVMILTFLSICLDVCGQFFLKGTVAYYVWECGLLPGLLRLGMWLTTWLTASEYSFEFGFYGIRCVPHTLRYGVRRYSLGVLNLTIRPYRDLAD